MKNVNTLQKAINDRAEKRLNEDLKTLFNNITTQVGLIVFRDVVEGIYVKMPKEVENEGKSESMRSALWSSSSIVGKHIYSKMIDKYIEDETKSFISSLDEMKNRLHDLENDINNY
jgi:hypothetical protein